MKTTVEISDGLLAEAKSLAAAESTTLRELIEQGLRSVVGNSQRMKRPFRLRDGSVGGRGMSRRMTWDEIRGEIYKGRGA